MPAERKDSPRPGTGVGASGSLRRSTITASTTGVQKIAYDSTAMLVS